jgi:hypothetical protein
MTSPHISRRTLMASAATLGLVGVSGGAAASAAQPGAVPTAPLPDGRALLLVHSTEGTLYRVNPANGEATPVDLAGETLVNGDGLLRQGTTLYAVLNRANEIAVVTLDAGGRTGTVTDRLTDSSFDIPTTVAEWGGRLYVPNARFDTEVTEATPYNVVSVPLPR